MQISTSEGRLLRYKLTDYTRSGWNQLDIIALLMFGICIVIRLVLDEQDFYWARIWYCLTPALYYFRSMRVFDINRNIGPQIIMIRQMVRNILHLRSIF